jgi:hypothetical protein
MTPPDELDSNSGCPNETVVCCPDRSNWAGVVLLLILVAALYGMMLIPREAGVPPMTARERLGLFAGLSILAVPLLAAAVWAALWIQRGAIVADAEKIMWRGAGRARGARWEEVSDYFFARVKSTTHYTVETRAGRLRFGGAWTNEAELAAIIARRACHARAREWEPREARGDAPWPRRFGYQSFGNRWFLPLASLLGFAYSGVMLLGKGGGTGVGQFVGEIAALYGWPLAALLVLTLIAMLAMMPLLLWAMTAGARRDVRRRWNETIEATPEGVSWTDGTRAVASTWDEVRAFHAERPPGLAEPPRFHVETTQGNWSFSGQVIGTPLLKRTIETHATQATPATWNLNRPEAGEQPVPFQSARGPARVFHYRTSLNRALLWFVAAFPFLPLLATLLSNWTRAMEEGFSPKPLPWAPTLFGLAIFAWLWWRMRAAAVVVSEDGIAQSSWNGVRFVPWRSVSKYFHTPETYWVNVMGQDETGRHVTLRFWISIGALEELRDEIEARALNASPRGWSDKHPTSKARRAKSPAASERR